MATFQLTKENSELCIPWEPLHRIRVLLALRKRNLIFSDNGKCGAYGYNTKKTSSSPTLNRFRSNVYGYAPNNFLHIRNVFSVNELEKDSVKGE